MTSFEATQKLKEMLTTAQYYASQTQLSSNSDPLHDSSTSLWIRQFHDLDFDDGLGWDVQQGTTSWKLWAEKFQAAVRDLLGYRMAFGFDGHEVKRVDSGVGFGGALYYVGERSDDPMNAWWYDQASTELQSIATNNFITWATEPLRQGAEAAAGILDTLSPLVLVVVVILILLVVLSFRVG